MYNTLDQLFHRPWWLLLSFMFLISGCDQSSKEPLRTEGARLIKPLNQGWRFVKTSPQSALSLPDSHWQEISLPHTWNAKDGQDGGDDYYRGTGTYKRTFTLPPDHTDKRWYIHFDGATTTAEVYINGHKVGNHKGNYAAFRFDITEHVHFDQDNTLMVIVNNEVDENVAPLSADFTFFGGLYRQARLIATDATHIDTLNYASSGVFWSQNKISKQRAELTVNSKLVNEQDTASAITVTAALLDTSGKTVAREVQELTLEAGQTLPFSKELVLDNPHLWHGRRDPYLYTARLSLHQDGQLRDQIDQALGLRFFHIDKDEGFILNGEPYPLYGVNRMADFPAKGTAVSQEDHERDIQLVLELGATAVRLGHQQRDDYVYRRADETGLVIWAEVPLINRINTNTEFSDNVKQQTLELVRQNYNHSAIMFWGLFNEITLKPGPDPRPLVRELNELVKQEDPHRLTTAAVAASGDSALNDPLATTTDITSFNRYYGWYYGNFNDLTAFMDKARNEYPERRIALSEFGAGASDQFHSDYPVMQDHTEEYQAIFHENYWQDLSQRPYVWGKFLWVLADFAVDNRDEGDTPGRNDKGLVTFDRKTKKDAFFWYKANWSDEEVVHITGRRFIERSTATTDIKVYSNQPALELVVNGQPLGKKRLDGEHKITWQQVPLHLGENTIQALTEDGKVADTIKLTRINSSDTTIRSSLLGVDSQQGKIYNLPYGLHVDELHTLLEFPRDSEVRLFDQGKPISPRVLNVGNTIRVIAQDGVTTQDYTIASAPISVAKPTSASAEISAPLSIGIIDIPAMTAAHANDGIVTQQVDSMEEFNIWNAMGKGPHWWKVDLGAEYYIDNLEVVWPQHLEQLIPGPMAYSVEVAGDFEQTFDNFSETYQEVLSRRDNDNTGTTVDKLGVEARFLRIRLHKTNTFTDAPIVGRYPIYGAEEIFVNGGLLKSESLAIDYLSKTIDKANLKTVAEAMKNLKPTIGGQLQFVDKAGRLLEADSDIPEELQVIAIDKSGQLRERYYLR